MAGLLSNAEDREIRDAIKLVTDTFMVTPITYHRSIGQSLDTWEEDKQDERFDNLKFSVLVEYGTEDVEMSENGNIDFRDVKLTVNLEDLEALYMIDQEYAHKFQQESDFFTLRGKLYKVKDIYYDGALSSKQALIIITGKLAETDKHNIRILH